MANALHVHHELIRRLILKHKLYEVKTIGDSFMCATHSAINAVEFALHLQRELFEYDWGTKAIDTAYLQQHQQQHEDKRRLQSHSGWNGLRVRVGIHFGLGTVHLDPVTKGYDYYGTVVNTAARVEAVCHGGQIGITQDVYDALKGEFPGAALTDLGRQILRGLAEPVHLYQLVPWELSERTFPPLRLEYAAGVEVEEPPASVHSAKMSPAPSRGQVIPVAEHSPVSPRSHGRSPTHARTGIMGAPTWVESHPLVSSGQLTAEDVTVRYLTVQKALMTLLETQTQRVREMVLHSFCERLQVRNTGCDGARLEDTIHGIVQRVLPSALTAACAAPRGRLSPGHASGSYCMSSIAIPHDFHSLDCHTLGPISPLSEFRAPISPLPMVTDL
eukprot:GGOE01062851.1.p1 GENE.GGOE01062851.1~~GGOE01062851.1.p1  ORF type:complete len:388 (+),score=124.39 GGOE01062851.1:587-1750(+)